MSDEMIADMMWLDRGFVSYSNAEIDQMGKIPDLAFAEMKSACKAWPRFNSAHEGYAVLLEEVDELWAHVKTNQKRRDISAMKKEAIQVAAMAMRFVLDVCNEEAGRK